MIKEKTAHAKYSASGSARWLHCAGSIALSEKAPPPVESKYAAEGTKAHEVLEFLIKNRAKRGKAAMMLRAKYPESMIIHAEMALDYIDERLRECEGAELHSEIKCELPVSEPDQFGTTDAAIIEHFGKLIIIDYKYGAGIAVPAHENSQLIYYALGLAHKYDYNFASVELVIIQPRAQIDGHYIRSWLTTMDTLIEWREKFEQGIKNAKAPDAPLKASTRGEDYCRFCPAKTICPELSHKALRQAQIDFSPEDPVGLALIPPAQFPAERLGKILTASTFIEKWIDGVREYAFNRLEAGDKIPGWKLGEKRGQRKWKNPEHAAIFADTIFGAKAFAPREILSPAQLEKLGGSASEFIEQYAVTVSSGMKLKQDEGRELGDDFLGPIKKLKTKDFKTVKKTRK